jgi:hypothetical protein
MNPRQRTACKTRTRFLLYTKSTLIGQNRSVCDALLPPRRPYPCQGHRIDQCPPQQLSAKAYTPHTTTREHTEGETETIFGSTDTSLFTSDLKTSPLLAPP